MKINQKQLMAKETEFSSWVSMAAKQSFLGLKEQKMISVDDEKFIQNLFTDERLKMFWTDFSKAGRFFFSEFFLHILHSHKHFQKTCLEHEKCSNEELSLKDRERKILSQRKFLQNVMKDLSLNPKSLMPLISALKNAVDSLAYDTWRRNKTMKRLTQKNSFRPRNRESFLIDKRVEKKAQSLAVGLYHFFQQEHIQKDWKKQDKHLKHHVCNIVDVLIDQPDNPLDLSTLSDYINNFHKIP